MGTLWNRVFPGDFCVPTFKYRILFVDDEPSIRSTTRGILQSAGYDVLAAPDGLAALECLEGPLPELVISDLRMPRMSGFELLAVIRQRFPQIPAIAISGEYVAQAPDCLLADVCLAKGYYEVPELLDRVKELLSNPPARPFPGTRTTPLLWVPMRGTGQAIVTCPRCLRSFELERDRVMLGVQKAVCASCHNQFTFSVDQASLDRFTSATDQLQPAQNAG